MKRVYWCILCMMILLTGCGGNGGSAPSVPLLAETDSEAGLYMADIWDAGITPEHQPLSNSFVLTEDMLYYVDKSGDIPVGVNRVSLSGNNEPVQQILKLENGTIEAIAVAGGKEELSLALAGTDELGTPFLAAYSPDGRQLWEKSYEKEMREQAVFDLAQDSNSSFYALCAEQILMFDAEGGYQGTILCPGESYIDICAAVDGNVYVTYRDGQTAQPVLAMVQYQGRRLEGELHISGNGHLGAGSDGNLLFQSGDEIYSFIPARQTAEKLLELSAYDLVGEQLQAMLETSAGEVLLVGWEMLRYDRPVQLVRLKEAAGELLAEDGRRLLTWLIIGPQTPDVEQIAAAFNRQSTDYKVVIETVSLKGLTDSAGAAQFDIDEGIYMCVNTRLLASESADLISFTSYQDMERYLAKGYLEDLTPYIAQSGQISREAYQEQVLACYARGDALYSIPPVFSVDTLMGRASDMGAEPGWTVEEFLGWLERHPDAVTKDGMTKENILEFCLKGVLEVYLDSENALCDFEGEDFTGLLRRINGLKTDAAGHWDDWEEQLEESKPVLERGVISDFSSCNAWENMYGGPLVYKGYPSVDGKPCHYYSGGGLGILSRSACKDGAYAFWEYYLLHYLDGDNHYYTDKEAYAEGMAHIADEQYAYTEDGRMVYRKLSETQSGAGEETDGLEWIFYMTDEQRDKQLELSGHMRMDTLESQEIRSIIREEASVYFAGVKGLEDTCRVIQSRVAVFLSTQ